MRERLLRLYLDMGQVNRAYTHAMDVEKKAPHPQSDVWYKCLLDVLQVLHNRKLILYLWLSGK